MKDIASMLSSYISCRRLTQPLTLVIHTLVEFQHCKEQTKCTKATWQWTIPTCYWNKSHQYTAMSLSMTHLLKLTCGLACSYHSKKCQKRAGCHPSHLWWPESRLVPPSSSWRSQAKPSQQIRFPSWSPTCQAYAPYASNTWYPRKA